MNGFTRGERFALRFVAESGAPVVLCPRSNLHIEGRPPPLDAILAAGISPALGTDSLASNASLDVLAEARLFAERFSEVPARALFDMATVNGARALARADLGRVRQTDQLTHAQLPVNRGGRSSARAVPNPPSNNTPINTPAAIRRIAPRKSSPLRAACA